MGFAIRVIPHSLISSNYDPMFFCFFGAKRKPKVNLIPAKIDPFLGLLLLLQLLISACSGSNDNAPLMMQPPVSYTDFTVKASAGPGAPLYGAYVTVTDREAKIVGRGFTNRAGSIQLRLPDLDKERLPLFLQTSGGTGRGESFDGHLQAYFWTLSASESSKSQMAAAISSTVILDLVSSASVQLGSDGGMTFGSEEQWKLAIKKVRATLGIGENARPSLLLSINNYVDYGRLQDAYQNSDEPGIATTYDELVAAIAAKASAGEGFDGLQPLSAYTTTSSSSTSGTTPAACNYALPTSLNANPVSVTPIEGIASAVIAGLTLAVTANPGTAAEAGYYAGKFFVLTGKGAVSTDSAQLTGISEEISCMGAQQTVAFDALGEAVTLSNASACSSALQTYWTSYNGIIDAAQPATVESATGVAGENTVTLQGVTQGVYEGYAITGDGIGLNSINVTGEGDAGVASVMLTGDQTANVFPGLTVSGWGIGANAVVSSVFLGQGVTTLTLSVENTASFQEETLQITWPYALISAPPVFTNDAALVTLNTNNISNFTGQVEYFYPISLANSDLLELVSAWGPTGDNSPAVCATIVNNALFNPGEGAGLGAFQASVQTAGGFLTQSGVQNLQTLLNYWGIFEYQAFVLANEYNNLFFPGEFTSSLSGAPSTQELTDANMLPPADQFPLCAAGQESQSTSACALASNLANAWPDGLYSDEIGNLEGSLAVNGYPGGLVMAANSRYGVMTGETALTPANWLHIYWQLGGNPDCEPSTFDLKNLDSPGDDTYYWTKPNSHCSQGPTLSSKTWPGTANVTIIPFDGTSQTQLALLSDTGPNGAIPVSDQNSTGTDGCFLGRPYSTNAKCKFNVHGFNPGAYPGAVETFANPQTAHTIMPKSSELANNCTGTGACAVQALLDGMNCQVNGGTVCPDPAQYEDNDLYDLMASNVGFYASDGQMQTNVWWNGNSLALNPQIFVYQMTLSYAYAGDTNSTSQTTPATAPTVSDLSGSCWAAGLTSQVMQQPPGGSSYPILTCEDPYYLTQPVFLKEGTQVDSFLLGRTWWPAGTTAAAYVPPAPVTTNTSLAPPGEPSNLEQTSITTDSSSVTVGWSRPSSAGSGYILGYTASVEPAGVCTIPVLSASGATGDMGSPQIQLLGTWPAIAENMTVSGSGIGVNATILTVEIDSADNTDTTVITLSVPNTEVVLSSAILTYGSNMGTGTFANCTGLTGISTVSVTTTNSFALESYTAATVEVTP